MSSECRRDELLAEKYGFKGRFTPRVPAFGAIEIHEAAEDRSNRNQIAVKGYQNKWGQALLALKALESISSRLSGYSIVLYSCNEVTLKAARDFSKRTGLEVTAFPKGALSNQEVLDIFQNSAVYIGLSTSDGISASMIEAMANGAIPIQSDTSCCDEWLENEKGGYLVPFDDTAKVAELVTKILEDENWQINAAKKNFETLRVKLDPTATKDAALQTYELLAT
jgi:glycosyltransferase involved in cell wall biosynthesis